MRARSVGLWALLVAVCLLHAKVLFSDAVYFTYDLTHVSFPWRVLSAELLQRGQLPLWNPYACLGLPLAGNMQTGVFHPLSLLVHLFRFGAALGWLIAAQQFLAAFWTWLWLGRLGLGRSARLAGAAVYALGGYMVGYLQFPNLQGAVAHMPALMLFHGDVRMTALAAGMAFLTGYPPAWMLSAACVLAMGWLWPGLGQFRSRALACLRTLAGLALGLALAAVVLLPGAELFARSGRAGGLGASERMSNAFSPMGLSAIVSPELARGLDYRSQRRRRESPILETIEWDTGTERKRFTFVSRYRDRLRDASGAKYAAWASCYIGFLAAAAAVLGMGVAFRRDPVRTGCALACLGGVLVLLLGSSSALSVWLWDHVPGLGFLRGPSRMSFMTLAALVPFVALGVETLSRSRLALLAACGILIELMVLGSGYYPTMPGSYYGERGALVGFLRQGLGSARYFQSTSSEVAAYVDKDDTSADYQRYKEEVFRTFKQKLFGVSNSVLHLAAASGDFEPLVPRGSSAVIEAMKGADAQSLARLMRWAGARFFLDRTKGKGPPLGYKGQYLWHAYEGPGAASFAYWLPAQAAGSLKKTFSEAPDAKDAIPLECEWIREDHVRIWGDSPAPGLVFVAIPRYPGWDASLNGKKASAHAALDAFQYVEVPAGAIDLRFVYKPWSFLLGSLLSLIVLIALIKL